MKTIILASGSPRRNELMAQYITMDFAICTSHFEEKTDETDPVKLTQIFARSKAGDVAQIFQDEIIIGADTVVCVDGRILGKPKSVDEAREMMKLISGRAHDVITGLCVLDSGTGKYVTDYRKTQVFVDELTDEFIEKYIATSEPYDKAGGYAIQGKIAKYISGISGCYYNVVGLPVECLRKLLEKMEVEV